MNAAHPARPLPVSVIIATRDRPAMLADAVHALVHGDTAPDEIVIIDQGSRSGSSVPSLTAALGDAAGRSVVRHIHVPWCGLSRANNHGAALARHDLLLFTHDDVTVEHGWCSTMRDALARVGQAGAVTGRVIAGPAEVPGGYAPALRDDLQPAVHRGRVGHDVIKPMNLGMHREVFEAVGGFDARLGPGTHFGGAEDADLGLRLLEHGFVVEYVPEAIVEHRAWRSPPDDLPLRWTYGVAQGAFYAKHLREGNRFLLRRIGADVTRRARRFPRRLLHEPRRALGDPLFLAGNVAGAVRWQWMERGR
jgi:GT2 family glycosyltransferase